MKRLVTAVLGPLVLGSLGASLVTQTAQAAPAKPFAVRIGTTAVLSASQQLSIPVSGRCAANTAGVPAFASVIVDQFPTLGHAVGTANIPCTGGWQTVVLETSASPLFIPGKATATATVGTASVQRQISIVSS